VKPGRTGILLALLAVGCLGGLGIYYLMPRHGECVKRNMMFWRTHVKATKLRDNLYLLSVYGTDLINGNTVALIGDEGVLLVDPGHPEMVGKERSALPGLRDPRVRIVIDSHAHSDHACANGELFAQGAIIVGHRNIKKFFDTDPWAPPRRPGDTPQVIYDDRLTLRFNGEQIQLIHPQRAHTDADTITVFERANLISTGDVFVSNSWPYMRKSSIDGYIAAQTLILGLANDKTVIVPGHGSVARRSDVAKSIERMREARRRIQALIDEGLTREQVVARHPLDDIDPFAGPQSARRAITSSQTAAGYIYDSLTGQLTPSPPATP
jgi:glyoxylase-like metal-dependent hydrolase (beta-lactamase superfamily II)